MSDVIKLLPDSVANQIAAGEVIQRPASVVKELVENAVDAGATKISVIIRDAGRTLIQIIDNGCGMSVTDARLAFERHSTSKIRKADDLFSLSTMGFRGEALASIAAVAQVEMKTMRQEDAIGTQIFINGSVVESQSAVATIPGTNMMIKNLFFNVPARRKFLKKDAVEFNNILHEFERLALVNPEVELSLVHNDVVIHQLNKHTLKQRIGGLFGKNIEGKIIPVHTETSIVSIDGFIGLPQNAKKRGALQYLFVNGRNMRHPYFHKAIISCYEQLIRPDEQPSYFLDFKVDPSTIDVNIHPTKNEIKFENEQHIWQILAAAVKESLGKYNAVPSIDFNSLEDMPEIPAYDPNRNDVKMPSTGFDSSYNPFLEGQNSQNKSSSNRPSSINTWRKEASAATGDWEQLYDQFISAASGDVSSQANNPLNGLEDNADNGAQLSNDGLLKNGTEGGAHNSAMQLKNKYILTQNRSGLLIIEQHRAHVKILHEEYLAKIKKEPLPSQQLIFSEILELLPGESNILQTILEQISRFGFDLSYLGDNSWAINGIPGIEHINSPIQLLKEIIETVCDEELNVEDRVYSAIALGMARSTAVRSGQVLTQAEMEHIISRLFSLSAPTYTPDGLRTLADITNDTIESLF